MLDPWEPCSTHLPPIEVYRVYVGPLDRRVHVEDLIVGVNDCAGHYWGHFGHSWLFDVSGDCVHVGAVGWKRRKSLVSLSSQMFGDERRDPGLHHRPKTHLTEASSNSCLMAGNSSSNFFSLMLILAAAFHGTARGSLLFSSVPHWNSSVLIP